MQFSNLLWISILMLYFPFTSIAGADQLVIHPFLESSYALTESNSQLLNSNLRITEPQNISQALTNYIGHPSIKAVLKQTKTTSSTSKSFKFTWNERDICLLEVSFSQLKSGASMWLGEVPVIPIENNFFEFTRPSNLAIQDSLPSFIKDKIGNSITNIKIHSFTECFFLRENELIPAYKMEVDSDIGRLLIWADEFEIFHYEKTHFHIASTIQTYLNNSLDTELTTFNPQVDESGFLQNTIFQTDPTGVLMRAQNLEYNFAFAQDSKEFAEATVFAHANRMYDYFTTLGFVYEETKPILIKLHDATNGNKNNALYVPSASTSTGHPEIRIGDGDGSVLRNLATDSDVVSHELGHHIVYRQLKSTSGESLRLHEGLADFFTFARSQDTCLGESICPQDSKACAVVNQCLRTAANNLVYNSTEYNQLGSLPHLQGQLISGMIWDLSVHIPLDQLARLVFNHINYYVFNSGYKHFIVSLLFADLDLHQGVHACKIIETAVNRGLGVYTEGIDCSNQLTWQRPAIEQEETPDSSSSKKSSSGVLGCGIYPQKNQDQSPQSSKWQIIFLLLLPLFAPYFRRSCQKKPHTFRVNIKTPESWIKKEPKIDHLKQKRKL